MVEQDNVFKGLEPVKLWSFFHDISLIPRPSTHESRVLEYLSKFASDRGLDYKQDAIGNMVIKRKGSSGGENAPAVAIQGHIDMVCEKNTDVVHNFFEDPIKVYVEGDWVKACGTTLGADNGIGVAAALLLLDMPPTARLPPLECLFTVDEEVGFTGAAGVDEGMLEARTMLNLDTEEWGELCIGSAGGADSKITLDLELLPSPEGWSAYELRVEGLMGGHSGQEIHEGRGNALIMAAVILGRVLKEAEGKVAFVRMGGGDQSNAIPRQATAVLLVAPGCEQLIARSVASCAQELAAEYALKETTMFIHVEPFSGAFPQVVKVSDAIRLLSLVRLLPNGPLKFSHAVPGLVETSNNVASVHPADNESSTTHVTYTVVCMSRSSIMSALETTRDTLELAAQLVGGSLERLDAFPGWQPNPCSPLLQVVKATFKEVLGGKEADVKACHGGLECGILSEKFPGMDIVSYGPTILGAHSPDERVQISTVLPFWQLTLRVLEQLADRRK